MSRSRSPRSDGGFRIRAEAFLLTYRGLVYPDQLRCLRPWQDVQEWTLCHEKGGQMHSHLYIVNRKGDYDVSIKDWIVQDLQQPDCSPCKAKGSSARRSRDRGHFYVFCEYKTTHLWSGGNYRPCKDYAVDLTWVKTLWQQGKVDDAVCCAAAYRVLTSAFESSVKRCMAQSQKITRREYHERRDVVLRAQRLPFRTYPTVEDWKAQYYFEQPRYKFLWLVGPTQMGKSSFARSLVSEPFIHVAGVSWASYNAAVHTGIIFDDCFDMTPYILKYKALFQCSGVASTNTSATNCYALDVDTAGKMMIVCSNSPSDDEWIVSNSFQVVIDQPVWVEQHAIEDRWRVDADQQRLFNRL